MNPDAARKALGSVDAKRFTDHTLTPVSDLMAELDKTRVRGWSCDHGERYEGMSCIGAAIYNDRAEPCAGISLSGPSVRCPADRATELGALVRDVAQETRASAVAEFRIRHRVEFYFRGIRGIRDCDSL